MSVELHITRAKDWSDNDDCPITAAEWLQYVANDPEFSPMPENGKYFMVWSGPSAYEQPWLDWFQGKVSTKWPDVALYRKMLRVAAALGARVQDDDGHVYTHESEWTFNPPQDT